MTMAKTGGSMFAHLMGRARAAADDKKKDDDTEAKTKSKAEDGDEDDDTDDKVDELEDKVEDLEDKVDDLEEDDEEDDKPDAGRQSEKEKDTAKTARKAERARCAAIFAAPAAAGKVALAAELAFGTNLSAKQAIGVLRAGGAGPRGGALDQRMEAAPKVRVGNDATEAPGLDTPAGAAASVLGAMKIARREKQER